MWRNSRKGGLSLSGLAHANDDVCGLGILESFVEAYTFIGATVNRRKTVVSNSTAIFCGQMYWKGKLVTPIRLDVSKFVKGGKGFEILPAARDFLQLASPVWGPYAKRLATQLLKEAAGQSVGYSNVTFELPIKLGGFATDRKVGVGILKLLENPRALRHALYWCPTVEVRLDPTTSMIGYVRLGKNAILPDGREMPSVNLPSTAKQTWIKRKVAVDEGLRTGTLSSLDVLEFLYQNV